MPFLSLIGPLQVVYRWDDGISQNTTSFPPRPHPIPEAPTLGQEQGPVTAEASLWFIMECKIDHVMNALKSPKSLVLRTHSGMRASLVAQLVKNPPAM